MIYLKEGQTPLNLAYNDEIIHEANSKYQLSFKYPTNNPLWEDLVEETLLLADDLHGEQEFIIFEVEKHHGYVTVYANQVATLLNNYSITELSVDNVSGNSVMRSLVSSIIREHNFTFYSDIANTHSINLKNVTVATALFKDKHSILGQWGGDLIRDKYDIRLLSNGGSSKEALFMYKKNLKSYQQKKSIKDLRTRIHFTKTVKSQNEGEKDKVIAVTVDSPLINKYKNIYEGNLDVSDQDVTDEATLRKYGENYFKTTLCDVIEENIEIDVVGVPDEPVGIFDTVTVFHEKFNLDVKKKITKYTYKPMGRKLKTIGFGKIQLGLGTALSNMIDEAVSVQVESKVDAFKIQKNLSNLLKQDRKSIENQMKNLEEQAKAGVEVKKALFEADSTVPEIVRTKLLDAVEADIGRLKTIITEAELIKAIQAKLNYAEIKNTLIDKAFINQIISDEKFTQQFEDGQVTTQNIFTKLKDSIKSNIAKEFITKDGVKKLVNDLTIDADGIRQITQQESSKVFETKKSQLQGINSYIHKKYTNDVVTGPMTDNSNSLYIGIYTGDKALAPTNMSEYEWTRIRGYNGVSSYIHRKYSDYSNGANMSDDSNLKYIGIYTGTSSTPPTTASSYSWSKIKGEDGASGVPGARGADGRTPYFHTAYANSPTGDRDFSTTNSTNKLYIGTYSDFEVADSSDYRKYKWVKIKGEDGARGRDGNNGRDGVSSYIHRKYSDNANGSPMSDNSNLKYIGIYTGTSAIAPTLPSAYTWSKIKGEDGQQGVPGARGSDGRTSYLHTAYSNSATGDRDFSTTNSTNKEYIGTYTDFEINDSSDYRRYKWIKIKGENGANGRNGADGHSLTANLRFEGTYINNITNNVKAYLDVFYDGQKVSSGFNAQIKFKGGILNTWSNFWTAKVDNTGFLTNVSWGNKEQQYPIALEVIVLVTYKDLNTVVNARMDNIPDVVAIKEVVKQYKTFDSRIDRFNSTIGEVKQQVLANEGKRNLVLGSRMLSESDYKVFGNKDIVTRLQSYEGLPYVTIFLYGKTSHVWQGIGFNTSVNQFRQGEKYSVRIPMLISSTTVLDNGGYVEIKNHRTGEVLWKSRLDTNDVERDKWVVREFTFTASKTMNTSDYSFWIFVVRNGLLTFGKPYMCAGDSLPKNYSPAPEDAYLQNSRLESSILQTKDEIGLKVSKNEVISAINLSVEKNSQGRDEGIVKIKGEVLADNIHGKTFTGSKFKIGQYGFLQPIEKGLQINAPENFGSKRGIGLQIAGEGVGPKERGVPPGLFIYEDPDFTSGASIPSSVNRVLLTVAGMACFSTRVLGSVIKGQPILTNIDYSYPFSNVAPVKFIGYREGGFMHFYGTDNTNSDKWLIKVDQWGSDRKLKTDIKESEFNAIEFVDKLKFKEHGWNKDEVGYDRPHTKCGLIAQELQELDASLVVDYGKYLGLDGLRLINISLKAIQELSTENTNLKSQLNEMNERLTKLEDKINGNI